MRDLTIIGAGPAGLAAAREAQTQGLDFVVLERGLVGDTIHQYPIGKPLFSTPEEIELSPGGLHVYGAKPTREELLTHYTRFVIDRELPVRTGEQVHAISRDGEGFAVTTSKGVHRSRYVLVATGINGIRKHLGVAGEGPERVLYRFIEAFPYAGKQVVVAGSGNSAAETAIYLEEVGANVTLVMRRPSFGADPTTGKPEIKWWVREPLEALQSAGRMNVLFGSIIAEIRDRTAVVESAESGRRELPCDVVFALLGTEPDHTLLVGAGVAIGEDNIPVYNERTHETNVPGLFVTGHITREKHIKGALHVAPRIIEHISAKVAESRTTVSS